jgi:hypothetical protein
MLWCGSEILDGHNRTECESMTKWENDFFKQETWLKLGVILLLDWNQIAYE